MDYNNLFGALLFGVVNTSKDRCIYSIVFFRI